MGKNTHTEFGHVTVKSINAQSYGNISNTLGTGTFVLNHSGSIIVSGQFLGFALVSIYNVASVSVPPASLQDIYVKLQTAPGGVDTTIIEVYKNGVATGSTVTLTGAQTKANVTGLNIPIAASDDYGLEVTYTGAAPQAVSAAVRFSDY